MTSVGQRSQGGGHPRRVDVEDTGQDLALPAKPDGNGKAVAGVHSPRRLSPRRWGECNVTGVDLVPADQDEEPATAASSRELEQGERADQPARPASPDVP